MSIIKLILVKYPLKLRSCSKKQVHAFCAAIWIFFCFYTIGQFLLVDGKDVYYDSRVYTCFYNFSSEKWKVLKPVNFVLLSFIPITITLVSSALLVKHLLYARKVARRTKSQAPLQGVVTVIVTAGVYCLSFIPISVFLSLEPFIKKQEYHVYVFRVGDTLKYFNVMANVFIYSLTVTSFRDFLRTRIWMVLSFVASNTSKTGKE
jgi:hypothetical protein